MDERRGETSWVTIIMLVITWTPVRCGRMGTGRERAWLLSMKSQGVSQGERALELLKRDG